MGFEEWQNAVKANVQERLQSGFDWSRVSAPVWATAFGYGLPPEHMGLALVVALAVVEGVRQATTGEQPNPAASPRIVSGTSAMTGASHVGKK